MEVHDITVDGAAMHGRRLSDIKLDGADLYAFVKEPLRELSRGQLSCLGSRWRMGIPRCVPDGDRDAYVVDTETDGGWRRSLQVLTDPVDAANALILSAVLAPQYDARLLRGRKAVAVYDAGTGMIVSG